MKRPKQRFMTDAEYERIRHGHLCPICNEPMVERTNRGELTLFFGCSQYPYCRGTRDTYGNATGRASREAEWHRAGADPRDGESEIDEWLTPQDLGYDGDW